MMTQLHDYMTTGLHDHMTKITQLADFMIFCPNLKVITDNRLTQDSSWDAIASKNQHSKQMVI